MKEMSWLKLWEELVTTSAHWGRGRREGESDAWEQRAQDFNERVKKKQARPDILRDFVISRLTPTDTVLDIGAGTGAWVIPMAQVAQWVTAIDPSSAMLAILRENIAAAGLTNVDIVEARWEDAEVSPHQVALCSHASYGSPDLAGFVDKMERLAHRCYLVLRLPTLQGIMAELCRLVKGHSHDSPNFIVAYNALLEMGRLPNALLEKSLRLWSDQSVEDAVERAKTHLLLTDSTYDEAFRDILARRLELRDGLYYWPDGMRSGLIWWDRDGDS